MLRDRRKVKMKRGRSRNSKREVEMLRKAEKRKGGWGQSRKGIEEEEGGGKGGSEKGRR